MLPAAFGQHDLLHHVISVYITYLKKTLKANYDTLSTEKSESLSITLKTIVNLQTQNKHTFHGEFSDLSEDSLPKKRFGSQ